MWSGKFGGACLAGCIAWEAGGEEGGETGTEAGGDGGCGSGEDAVECGEGSLRRHERRTARLASISLTAMECSGAGVGVVKLLGTGDGERDRDGGVCWAAEERMVCINSAMWLGDLGMMDLRRWRGIGEAGLLGWRSGRDVVVAPGVCRQALEESVNTCGGEEGGRSLRKFRIISWVDSAGLSSSGVPLGEVGWRMSMASDGTGGWWWSVADGCGEGVLGDTGIGEGGGSSDCDTVEGTGDVVRELVGDEVLEDLLLAWDRE